jgi:membrane-bound lytic murein transglycosylase F
MRRMLLAAVLVAACGKSDAPPAASAPAAPAPHPPLVTKAKTLEAAPPATTQVPPIPRDLPDIAAGRELRVLFTFNSTGYFIHRGATMGYEYELLQRFAADQKLRLVPVVVRDSRSLFERLNKGEGDVVAAQVTPGTSSGVAFTHGLYSTSPVVVQRKTDLPPATKQVAKALARERAETADPQPVRIRARLIGTPSDLAGARVHLPQTSPYRSRLVELNHELSDDVEVVEVDTTSDRLIQQTSEGDIAYTVAAENLAALKAGEYTNLIVKPAIGAPQQVVWAVRVTSPKLQATLDAWIDAKTRSGLFRILYRKYFEDRRGFTQRAASRYLTTETGRLSAWDDDFREFAKIPGWDWRLVASQAYQESRFQPSAKSWAGAVGLMQIMPATARELRVNPANPRQSIEGACRYLWKLDQRYTEIASERERVKFILAAYNVGAGHVEDARRLAKKFGDDPNQWDDVAYWLIRKSKRSVYSDPVVKYGFARGTEPVTYVDVILDRYEHYRQFVGE